MITKELLDIMEIIKNNHEKNFKKLNLTKKELIFSGCAKLQEELGELSSEILINAGIARDVKISKFKQEDLELEFADVIMATLLQAKFMDIDINKAIEKKVKKIQERGGF